MSKNSNSDKRMRGGKGLGNFWWLLTARAEKGGATGEFETAYGGGADKTGIPKSLINRKIVLVLARGTVGANILVVFGGGTTGEDGEVYYF